MSEKKNKKELEKKLARAYQLRDFEIEMYWKRAQYFWSFLAVIYAGYFLVISYDGKNPLPILYPLVICSIGCVFSLAWYFVNRGSKRWQIHWEEIIKELEGKLGRSLYSAHVDVKEEIFNAGYYSVSRVNIFVSIYVFATWIFLGIFTVLQGRNDISIDAIYIIGFLTLIGVILMYFLGNRKC